VAGEPGLDYPVVFGYRAAGEVVDSRSSDVPVGSRIFGTWRHTEYTSIPGDRAAAQLVPEGLGWDDAVDLGQMGPICVNAAAYGEGDEVGCPAVVFGAGPIGLITAQIVRAAGAEPVYVVDRLEQRVEIARDLGLEGIVAAEGVDVARELKHAHSADAIPVAWECSGSTFALADAIRVVRRQGSVVAVGFYQGETKGVALGDEFHHNAVRIVSAQIGNPHPSFDRAALQRRTVDLAVSGRLVLGRLPRDTVPVEEVAAAFRALTRPTDVLQVALAY
jgi:threonine dehydrogenase-like Zn-dependent dehydrogenase